MDDIVIFFWDKKSAHNALLLIQAEVEKLGLKIKSNYQIFPTAVRGVDFLGYVIFPDKVLVRKTIAQKFRRSARKIEKHAEVSYHDRCALASYAGWLKYADARTLERKYSKGLICLIMG